MEKWKTLETVNVMKAHVFRYIRVKRESPLTKATGDFDVVQCSNWVNVIALTKDKEIVLVKQYRHGTDTVTYEVPAGAINMNEDPLIGAKRELAEESGYTSSNWKFLGVVDVNPAFMTNKCYVYLALDAIKTQEQNLDPFEEIEVELAQANDISAMVMSGKITHSLVVNAFYFLERHLESERRGNTEASRY